MDENVTTRSYLIPSKYFLANPTGVIVSICGCSLKWITLKKMKDEVKYFLLNSWFVFGCCILGSETWRMDGGNSELLESWPFELGLFEKLQVSFISTFFRLTESTPWYSHDLKNPRHHWCSKKKVRIFQNIKPPKIQVGYGYWNWYSRTQNRVRGSTSTFPDRTLYSFSPVPLIAVP